MIGLGIAFSALGLLLVMLEFFIPGAILGILGCLALLGSIALVGFAAPMGWLLLYVVLLGILVWGACKAALYGVKRTRKRGSYFLGADQAGIQASAYDPTLAEKRGIVATDLKPSGHVLIEKERYQAVSSEGYLSQGTPIKVLKVEGARLVVQKE
jgi:membrane-bound ClpP family serine protease